MNLLDYIKKLNISKADFAEQLRVSRQLLDYWINANYKVVDIEDSKTVVKVIASI